MKPRIVWLDITYSWYASNGWDTEVEWVDWRGIAKTDTFTARSLIGVVVGVVRRVWR